MSILMKHLIAALAITSLALPAMAEPEPTISCVGVCHNLEHGVDRDCDFVMAVDEDRLQMWGMFPFSGTYKLWPDPVPGYADADRTDEKGGMYYRMYIRRLAGLIEVERSKIGSDGSRKVAERFKGTCHKPDPLF